MNEGFLKLLTTSSNCHYLDLSYCGISSPIDNSGSLAEDKICLPAHLKYLNLSHNSLNEEGINIIHHLWRKTWGEKTNLCSKIPFVIFRVNSDQ